MLNQQKGRTSVRVRSVPVSRKFDHPCTRGICGAGVANIEAISIETYDRYVINYTWQIAKALDTPALNDAVGACYRVWNYGVGLAFPWQNDAPPYIDVMPFADLLRVYPQFAGMKIEKDLMLVMVIDPFGNRLIHNAVARMEKTLRKLEYPNYERAGFITEPNGWKFDFTDGRPYILDVRMVHVIEIDDFSRNGQVAAGNFSRPFLWLFDISRSLRVSK